MQNNDYISLEERKEAYRQDIIKESFNQHINNLKELKEDIRKVSNKQDFINLTGEEHEAFIYEAIHNKTGKYKESISLDELKNETNSYLDYGINEISSYKDKFEPFIEDKNYEIIFNNSSPEMQHLQTNMQKKEYFVYEGSEYNEVISAVENLNYRLEKNKEIQKNLQYLNQKGTTMYAAEKNKLISKITLDANFMQSQNALIESNVKALKELGGFQHSNQR